jgi:hypothetical protein
MSNPNRSFRRNGVPKLSASNGPSDPLKAAAQVLVEVLPKDWGFAVLAFPLDSRDGGLRYVSNGDRESVMKLLRDFVAKQDAPLVGVAKAKQLLETLSYDDRLEALSDFCKYCGGPARNDGGQYCTCMRDD